MKSIKTSFGEIKSTIQDGITLYKVSDITKCIDVQSNIVRQYKGYGEIIKVALLTKGGVQRDCNFTSVKLVSLILSRYQSDKSVQLAKELGIEIHNVRIESKEENTIMFIVKCFMDRYKMTRQFKVDRYRVDLYIHKLNLIVECDENDHAHYDKTKDQERTEIINSTLANPAWVRYNPDNDLSDVIRIIVNHQN